MDDYPDLYEENEGPTLRQLAEAAEDPYGGDGEDD